MGKTHLLKSFGKAEFQNVIYINFEESPGQIKQIFELRPIREDPRALEEVQRLCELAKATLDDSYCKDMIRALGACADCLFTADKAGAGEYDSIQALIQSLLAVFEGRLQDLERNRRPAYRDMDARIGHGNRRHAQRRDYVTRPASAAAHHVCDTSGRLGARR